jgi:hypothetical protein
MRAAIGGLVLLLLCGCGSTASIPIGDVSGAVTYRGKPLDHGTVVFMPEDSGGGNCVPATAEIASDGSYKMRYGADRKGVALGKYVVTVQCCEKLTDEQARNPGFVPKSLIPSRYSNGSQSGLRIEVKPGKNPYDIVLE